MSKVISLLLESDSIRDAINEINKYQEELNRKTKIFVDKLFAKGITVSNLNKGIYSPYIEFSKNVTLVSADGEIIELLIGYNTGHPVVEWYDIFDNLHEAEINPILMAEFGSGWFADDTRGKAYDSGQGTFPGQKHAKEPEWHFKDLSGNWHSSSGYRPTEPLLKAAKEMQASILSVAREVFGSGI